MRTEYQRDRDRIIHSQGLPPPQAQDAGVHRARRATTTSRASRTRSRSRRSRRTIARALNLNEDLAEAIALGHDLGHTPFGHAGEQALGDLLPDGFRHNEQSVRIVDSARERAGAGPQPHLGGARGHPQALEAARRASSTSWRSATGPPNEWGAPLASTLEGQIVRLADSVAYLNHDIADAVRAGAPASRRTCPRTPAACSARRTRSASTRWSATSSMRRGTRRRSRARDGAALPIAMSADVSAATDELRDYLFENVYLWEERLAEADARAPRHRVPVGALPRAPGGGRRVRVHARGGSARAPRRRLHRRHDRPLRRGRGGAPRLHRVSPQRLVQPDTPKRPSADGRCRVLEPPGSSLS